MKKRALMKMTSLLVLSTFVLSIVISCGGKGGGGTATVMASSSQASSSASAAQGAVALSAAVGSAAGIAEGSVPPEGSSAPGKTGSTPNTADISKLDPRLQDVVDKMLGQLRRPTIQKMVSKASGSSKMMSVGAPPCARGGSYTISDTVSTVSGTTHVLSVSFTNCRDSSVNGSIVTYYDLAGSLTGTYQINNDNSRSAVLNVDLTTVEYSDLFTTSTGTLVLNGDFSSSSDSAGTSGTNTADGSFSVTSAPANGNLTLAFTFTNVNDAWTKAYNAPEAGDITEEHTGSGAYLLSITNNATLEQITLTVTLADLTAKKAVNGLFTDEWVNGRIDIQWSDNVSAWCVSGTYDFTTEAATPVRTFHGSICPASGKVQINNATIEYGKPFFPLVTFTINGISHVFANCTALGGGACR